jgi:sigma-B regulation protein RsbU (phosphoserine phosphatase)
MERSPIPIDEDDRLAELAKLDLLFTPPEEAFDRVTRKLADAFEVPVATMSLINRDVLFYKSEVGLPAQLSATRTIPREVAICGHVVGRNQPLIVEDLSKDERFHDNPMVGLGARFYAGMPLRTDTGQAVGSLCIVDSKPRQISTCEQALLKIVGEGLMTEVKLRSSSRKLLDRTREIEADLAAARAVQRFLLPPDRQVGQGFVVCHTYHPFDLIGGDFVDAFVRPDGSAVLLLADVSGHGCSAALTSAMTKTVFQHIAPTCTSPTQLLSAINRSLCKAVGAGRFMTATAVICAPGVNGNADGMTAHFASAGHPPPVIIRSGKVEELTVASEIPLLIDEGWQFNNETPVSVQPGDRILLYTDGATEAVDPGGKMLEPTGLHQVVGKHGRLAGDEFLRQIYADVRSFAAGKLHDDLALVCVEMVEPVGVALQR